MPQSRGRVYFVLLQKSLVSAERFTNVFHDILKRAVLPAYKRGGVSSVFGARQYVKHILETGGWSPTLPIPSEDCTILLYFFWGGCRATVTNPPSSLYTAHRGSSRVVRSW